MTSSANLKRLLHPRSIAFIGGRHAELALRQSQAIGFGGEVWPVNPGRDSLAGLPCYPSLSALPEAPDAALVAVPAEATTAVVGELAAMSAGGAVCFATGFAEVGAEGAARQKRLVETAGDLALVGPNCIGILNYLDGAALWPDEQGGERCESGAAILSQSGNVAINLTMQDRSLPLAYVISLGNQAGLGIADYVEGLLEDPRVSAIGLYLEQLLDVPAFERAALKALRRSVPIVVLKLGASDAGARSVMSHTSALAGADTLYQALFERLGVLRVESPAVLVETLKLFTIGGVPRGRRLLSLSCSGGEAALVGDLVAARGLPLDFVQPDCGQADKLGRLLAIPPGAVGNPLDYNTVHWGEAAALEPAFAKALEGHDMALLLLDYPRQDRGDASAWEASERAWAAAVRGRDLLPAVASSLPERLPAPARRRLIEAGITPLQGLTEALAALAAAADYGTRRPLLLGRPARPLLPPQPTTADGRLLDETEAKQLLAAHGLAAPEGRVLPAEQVLDAAREMAAPLVLKAVHPLLAHKTEAGAVTLGLRSQAEVEAALAEMRGRLAGTPARDARFLLEPMIEDMVAEVILGVQVSAPFGPALLLGSGGILAELVGDSVSLLLPVEEAEVRTAIDRLRVSRLLHGWRGRPAGDLEALVAAALSLAQFAEKMADRLLECDVNPLLVRPWGQGVVVADALLRLR